MSTNANTGAARKITITNLTPGASASWLVVGELSAVLIDSGVGGVDLPAEIKKVTDKPVRLVTTHMHFDHTAGHEHFLSYHMHPLDFAAMDRDIKSQAKPLRGGQTFDLGGALLEAVELPGHTPGSTGFLCRSERVLFTGDMVSNGPIYMIDGQCDFNAFVASMEKILAMDVDELYVCHGEPLVLPKSHCERQIAAAKAYMAGELEPAPQKFGFTATGGKIYTTDGEVGFFVPGELNF